MGSSVGILGPADHKSKAIVTQVRQENVRLHARVERLSVEASQLREEINCMLKEKQTHLSSDDIGNITLDSPAIEINELPNAQDIPPGSCAENYLQWELEKLKQENNSLVAVLADMKNQEVCTLADNKFIGSNSTDQGGTI